MMAAMPKKTTKTRTEYGYRQCRWSRAKCAKWVQSKRCPKCKQKRLFPGPDYDRFRITCLQCGFRAAIKPPKEALRELPAP